MSTIRNIGFRIRDTIAGGQTWNAYKEIRGLNERDEDDPFVRRYCRERLEALLRHASSTTRFYARFKGQSLELRNMPVISKMTIRHDYEGFLSKQFQKHRLYRLVTSGSTGTPFVCYQDETKKQRVYAEVIYYSGKLGYRVGKKLTYLRSIVDECNKSALTQWIQNIYLVDCCDLSDHGIERILGKLERKGHRTLLQGYSSTFDAIKDYSVRYDLSQHEYNVYGVVCGSDMLFDETRRVMQEVFKCKCVSRYSNEENGILGQDAAENNVFILNRANYFFEVLKFDSDSPAAPGEVGRIVVTDFFNYAMPMIRYDTGDVGSLIRTEEDGVSKLALSNFGGRITDQLLNTKGEKISPHAITNTMWRFSEVIQFQVIQKGVKVYTVCLNVRPGFSQEPEILEAIKKVFGHEAQVSFAYVDEVPVLSSGKRRYLVNEMLNKRI